MKTKPNDPVNTNVEKLGEAIFSTGGLTKREYFAALTLQGILAANPSLMVENSDLAESAVILADELISKLNESAKDE